MSDEGLLRMSSGSGHGRVPRSRMTWVVVDSSVLLATVVRDDPDHDRCLETLSRDDLHLVIPLFVVSETAYLVEMLLGPVAEAAFLETMADYDVETPASTDWARMASLITTYADFPLGTVDASIITIAERLGISTIITLDRRHLLAVRPSHVPAFDLLPE